MLCLSRFLVIFLTEKPVLGCRNDAERRLFQKKEEIGCKVRVPSNCGHVKDVDYMVVVQQFVDIESMGTSFLLSAEVSRWWRL